MTKTEFDEMIVLAETIHTDIHRMCEASKIAELDVLAFHAEQYIKKLRDLRYRELTGQEEK